MRSLAPALAGLLLATAGFAQEVPKPVKLMEISAKPTQIERLFYGQVQALQTVDLAFQVAGQIETLDAEEGTYLKMGQTIAQLDLDRYRRAKSQAEINLEKAQRDVTRLESLRGQAVSEVSVNDAQTQLNLAEIGFEDAQDNLEHATLHAPFDALVARRLVANFTTVSAGTPVVRLHDVSELRVDIEVPEVLFRQAGGSDTVTFSAQLPGDPTSYPLTMREFETETSSVGQTYTLTLSFDDPPGDFVFPGASVTVIASASTNGHTGVILPETALIYAPDGSAAVMVYDDGIVRRTPVQIEIRADGRTYLKDGLEDGTQIMLTGAALVTDGQSVRPFTRVGE
ncbi:efflux RND transporter periplasmic adaptor subunit [Antarctobacter sp.]|uniref:efflux RND transporter periplasmic adaptor subunit n=1 Tax=Antarctobacter sp. TaxID=1872577 RepID=UPI002B274CAD|nr:efflux RND transporter periplasmic adaptor subunit [Antarctobacter sp.]